MKIAILIKGAFSDTPEDRQRESHQVETAQVVAVALAERGCETSLLPLAPPDFSPLATLHCDLVFNLYAATGGEQALVAALLELTGLPYTGSAPLGHFLARNKHCAKAIWRDKGLPTPRSFEGELPSPADFPVIVKPARGGSGEGVDASSVIHDQAGLARHLARMEQRFAPLLVEQYISGQELTVGLLGDPVRALPTLEVAFDRLPPELPPIYGFEAKIRFAEWVEERQAALPADVDAEVQRISREAFVALELRDFARADLRLDSAGQPWLLEMNSLPGLQPGYSSMPRAAALAGMSYGDLIGEVVELALRRRGSEAAVAT